MRAMGRLQLALSAAAGIIAILLLYAPVSRYVFNPTRVLRDDREEAVKSTVIPSTERTSPSEATSWDIQRHLGGNSPWIPNLQGDPDTGIDPPMGCLVDQVHMMSRHGERYPTLKSGIRMLELYQRIQRSNATFHGPLAFLNTWNFFAPHPSTQFENLITTGPYAGTLSSFTSGHKLRTRYLALLQTALARGPVRFWASDCPRVIETAQYFATAFFGHEWASRGLAALQIIPETAERGADTLTPGRACPNYVRNRDGKGHEYGAAQLSVFRATYLPAIARRLRGLSDVRLGFDEVEVYAMQEMCGFETMVRGERSAWCEVFTREEWESFEYARDLLHYYRAGPGNPHGPAMGSLWLNATAELLRAGSEKGPLFLSFDHDGDMVALLAALDIFHQEPDLPTSHVLRDRAWRLSDIVPMGGRIIFERLICAKPQECWDNGPLYPNHVYCSPPVNETFVRLNINDGIMTLPGCEGGPGKSCPLSEFLRRVEERGKNMSSYKHVCGLTEGVAEQIEFLQQRTME